VAAAGSPVVRQSERRNAVKGQEGLKSTPKPYQTLWRNVRQKRSMSFEACLLKDQIKLEGVKADELLVVRASAL
jgi:hypothetical protein